MAIYSGMSDLNRSYDDGLKVSSAVERSLDQEELAASLENVGPLSAVALQIVDTIDSETADGQRLSAEIGRDPVIAAKVLSVANSAFYGGGGADSLTVAVSRLGMQSLRNLVLAAAVSGRQHEPIEKYPFSKKGLWRHSLMVALLAQRNGVRLANLKGRSSDLFLGGLLHDMGKMITSQLLDATVNSTGSAALTLEVEAAGCSHVEAGLLLAEEWNLPSNVQTVIAWHHEPANAPSDTELVAAIALFDVIANRRGLGLTEDALIDRELPHGTLQILGLSDADFMALEEALEEQFEGMDQLVEALA